MSVQVGGLVTGCKDGVGSSDERKASAKSITRPKVEYDKQTAT
jgi:hypothetical protein